MKWDAELNNTHAEFCVKLMNIHQNKYFIKKREKQKDKVLMETTTFILFTNFYDFANEMVQLHRYTAGLNNYDGLRPVLDLQGS